MKKLSIILNFAILAIMSAVTMSCNGSGGNVSATEPIEITKDEIIVLPTTDLFSYKLSDQGLRISDTYFGPKAYKFREEYNFKAYESCTANVGYSKKIEAFDLYELGGSGLTLATDVRGLAITKANGHLLVILLSAHNPCLAMRMKYTVKANFDLSPTDVGISENILTLLLGIEDKEKRATRILIMPQYFYQKNLPPIDSSNFAELTALPGDGLKPQQDTTVVFPCYGDKPQIDCEKDGNGSRVIVRNAEGPGKDASFKIDAAYNYTPQEVYNVKGINWHNPQDVAGACFGLPNGKFLNIVQCRDKNLAQQRYSTSIDATKMDGNFDSSGYRSLIYFKNRSRDVMSLPFYFPLFGEE